MFQYFKRVFQASTVLLMVFVVGVSVAWAVGAITRASVSSAGVQGNGSSLSPSVSADGQIVAFYSWASNLVAGDTNGYPDVFVYDSSAGTTTRVNVSSGGVETTGMSGTDNPTPVISADGRYVAFESKATNLVPGDTNGTIDIFVRDLASSTTTRVSVSTAGAQATGSGALEDASPAISADGRYVAFESGATNLVAGDTNGQMDIFARDTVLNTTTRVSVDSAGLQRGQMSWNPSISADGRYVAFSTWGSFVAGDVANLDIYVRDTVSNTTTLVSRDSAGVIGNGNSTGPSVSANGRYVAFYSDATNLVSGDSNGRSDVFVRDLVSNTTTRVNLDTTGAQGLGDSTSGAWNSGAPAISADGRYVAFETDNALVPGDTNAIYDVFMRDTVANTTTRLSVDSAGVQSNGDSRYPVLSADGRTVAFAAYASNLVAGDTNAQNDVFLAPGAPAPTTSTPASSEWSLVLLAIAGAALLAGTIRKNRSRAA